MVKCAGAAHAPPEFLLLLPFPTELFPVLAPFPIALVPVHVPFATDLSLFLFLFPNGPSLIAFLSPTALVPVLYLFRCDPFLARVGQYCGELLVAEVHYLESTRITRSPSQVELMPPKLWAELFYRQVQPSQTCLLCSEHRNCRDRSVR